MRKSKTDESSAVALYIRLARVMREHISGGLWQPGDRLPTVEELGRRHNVARVTVRQAIALLAKEGLLSSTRGRGTFVEKSAHLPIDDPQLRLAINDRYELAPGETIRVLNRNRNQRLPSTLALDAGQSAPYARIRKIHLHNGVPFVYLDAYVAQEVYNALPRGADSKVKLQRLIKEAGTRAHLARQEITLCHATPEVGPLLHYVIGAPLIRLRSWRFDKAGRTTYATTNLYRGDLFVLDYVEQLSDRNERAWLTPLPQYR